jgi:hypothetical protein
MKLHSFSGVQHRNLFEPQTPGIVNFRALAQAKFAGRF